MNFTNNFKISKETVNREFLIRYVWDNERKSYFCTAEQYIKLIGDEETAFKHFTKVFSKGMDKVSIKLRRGLKIDFYSK